MFFKNFDLTNIVFLDFETTGLSPEKDHPTEVAVKRLEQSPITGQWMQTDYNEMIQLPQGVEINDFIQELTGLTTEKVNSEGISKDQVKLDLTELIDEKSLIVAQSANFDLGYLKHHFDIEPTHFICTKTVEFFTAPHLSTSLNDLYKRYAPEKSFEQTHRAMDDVEMMVEVFLAQANNYGADAFGFFVNRIAVMPERPLVYKPHNAIVLDYSEKYVQRKTLEKVQESYDYYQERSEKLSQLEAYGVDNWQGYGEAMSALYNEEGE